MIRKKVDGKTKATPWTDIISPDRDLVKFSVLRRDTRLPLNFSTSLQEELNALIEIAYRVISS